MKHVGLSKLLDISIGRTPSRNEPRYWGEGYPWVSIRDLNSKVVKETREQITRSAIEETRCKPVKSGTLLFSFKLTIGKVAFAGRELFTNEAIAALSIKDRARLNTEYLYCALQSATFSGSNQAVMGKTLNLKSLGEIEIPLPPLNDQIRIALLLGKVEGLIARRKQQLAQLDALLKSVFLETFGDPVRNEKGWEKRPFEAIATEMRNGLSPSKSGTEKGHVYTLSAITGKCFQEIYKEDTFSKIHDKYYPRPNDFLVCRGNGNINLVGKGYFHSSTLRGIIFPDTIIAASIDLSAVNKDFLESLWKTGFMRRQIESSSRTTNGAHKINQSALEKLEIILPSMVCQTRFASIVEKIEALKSRYHHSLTDLQTLYATLSQKAFNGELDLSRVPLPAIDLNPNPMEGDTTVSAELETPITFAFPDLGLPVEALVDEASRLKLLLPWLESWHAHLGAQPFVAQDFLDAAQSQLGNLYPDSELELGMAAYEHIKDWVFESLGTHQLKQGFDEASKRITLNAAHA